METFSNEVKQQIVNVQNGYCYTDKCYHTIHSIHHKLQNTKHNRAKYPLFIHSVLNAVGLCMICHANFAHEYRITDKLAELYEQYLRSLYESDKSASNLSSEEESKAEKAHIES